MFGMKVKNYFINRSLIPVAGAVLFIVILCLSIPGFASELFAMVKEIAR